MLPAQSPNRLSCEKQLEQLLESTSRPSSPEPLLEPSYSSPPSPNFNQKNPPSLPITTQRAIRLVSISAIIISAILLFRELFAQSSACNFKIPNTSSIFRPPQNDNNILSHPLKTVEYSIKPVVYIFPQYYPFAENDKIWGENFTEWNNVLKVTHNVHGLETIRPHESIGYYDGLSLSTRRRQAKLINENGFYGLAYHHYWMSGKPIMDHILQAMLKDGEPNTPFMLSWANEPWIGTWEGQSSETTFIAQDYGNIVDWRKHFDYLLPFFRHKKYIRSAGKVQFIMYKADDMDMRARGTKTSMYAAFRIWAVEEGLGGMDIIESKNSESYGNGMAHADAVNEFQPHAGGMNSEFHHEVDRTHIHPIFHRGTIVCWDATPRHASDGRAFPWPTCHPKSWQYTLVRMMARIKGDPNPPGVENFLFINALNEWGEGSCIEPSVQFGHGYIEAMRNAVRISAEKHVWQKQEMQQGRERIQQFQDKTEKNATEVALDVCVLIRTSDQHYGVSRFPLDNTLWSLQAQKNRNWRAIIFDPKNNAIDTVREMDPRFTQKTLPNSMLRADATEWIITHLAEVDGSCASAKYMLIADAGNEYSSSAFLTAASSKADFVALNVESRATIRREHLTQEDICARLMDSNMKLSQASQPRASEFDLSATLVSLPKYLALEHTFYSHPTTKDSQEGGTFAQDLVEKRNWSWELPNTNERQVLHNPSYTGCKEAGHIWVDSMDFEQTGCYSTPELAKVFGAWDGDLINMNNHGVDFSKLDWKNADLEFYRRNGLCMRSKVP